MLDLGNNTTHASHSQSEAELKARLSVTTQKGQQEAGCLRLTTLFPSSEGDTGSVSGLLFCISCK